MEQRLRSQSTTTAPNLAALTSSGAQPQEQRSSPATSPRHARAPVGNAFPAPEGSQQADDRAARRPAPLPKDQAARQYHGGSGSRPGTGRAGQQAVPGALPPTPVASEGEYEMPSPPGGSARDAPSSTDTTAASGTVSETASADFVLVHRSDGDDGEHEA